MSSANQFCTTIKREAKPRRARGQARRKAHARRYGRWIAYESESEGVSQIEVV